MRKQPPQAKVDKTSGSPRVTLRLHQLKNRGSSEGDKKERGGAKSAVADAESYDTSAANMEGASKSSTPPGDDAQLKETGGGGNAGNGGTGAGGGNNASGGGAGGSGAGAEEKKDGGGEGSAREAASADAGPLASSMDAAADQQPAEATKRHAPPDEDEESRRKRRKAEDVPAARGKNGSTSGGSPKSTGGAESEGEDGAKSVESPGPKVPPLKIVIPSMESEQGTRNGKSTTRHHQALPYVVARSEPAASETAAATGSTTGSTSSSSSSSGNASANNSSSSGATNNNGNNGNNNNNASSNVNNNNNTNTNNNNNNNTTTTNNNNNNNVNNNNNNTNNNNSGSGTQQPQQPQPQPQPAAAPGVPPTPASPPALAGSSQPTSDPDNGTSLSADEQRSHQRVLRSSHRSGGGSSGAPSGSSSPVAPDNPSPQNISPPPSEPSSVPMEQKPHGSPSEEKPADTPEPPSAPVDLHPRKRKLKPRDSNQTSESSDSAPSTTQIHPHDQPITNCYQLFLNIRKQIDRRRKGLFPVQPKPPQGFKDYLMNRCTYVLAGNASSRMPVPQTSPPPSLQPGMKELFAEQEKERYRLRMQHVIEKEKLVLSVEQEILRVHGRAARALANQALPFSACTILRDEEVYSAITPEQEEKDRNARSRYNGRLFLSWLQDVDDKWEKIKEAMLLRHHNEAESLHAVQKMDWEWKLKELGICEFKARPTIDDSHVPMVHVSDDFDLLPA